MTSSPRGGLGMGLLLPYSNPIQKRLQLSAFFNSWSPAGRSTSIFWLAPVAFVPSTMMVGFWSLVSLLPNTKVIFMSFAVENFTEVLVSIFRHTV